MAPARLAVGLAALLTVGYLLHRALLAMERRGWVYYRSRGRASAGVALGALDDVFHPSARVTVVEQEEQQQRGPRAAVPADPPETDGPAGDGAAARELDGEADGDEPG